MAEALGLVASVVQLAGTGLKLSQALYQYADGVANADRRIKEVAKEIRLTSFVIDELGNIFKQDATLSLISDSAVATASETLKECSTVFEEIETTLDKSRKGKIGRLMLPFRENKIELLRNHIDKLKSTLQLLMQVLLHANQVASNKIDREAETRQRDEIRQLLEEKKNITKRYEESLRNFAASDSSTEVGDDEFSFVDDKGPASMIEVKTISSTLDSDSLAVCMEHVRTLLESMERLQQAIANTVEGDDYSDHQQAAVGSYFAARSHLDSILLGNSNTTNLKDTGMPIREAASMKTSTSTSDAEPCAAEKKEEVAIVLETSITTNTQEKTKQTIKPTYLQRLIKPRKKTVPEQARTEPEVVPRPAPVISETGFGGSGGFGSSNGTISYSNPFASPRAAAKPPVLYSPAPTFGNAGPSFPGPGLPASSPFPRSSPYIPYAPQQNRQQIVVLETTNVSQGMDPPKHDEHATASDVSGERREDTRIGRGVKLLEVEDEGKDEVDDLLREWTTCFA